MLEAATCDELNGCMSPMRPEQTWVTLLPGDLWTDVGEFSWAIELEHASGRTIPTSVLSEVSASVLVQHIDGTPVPGVTTEVVVGPDSPHRARIEVRRAEELADGWYVLSTAVPEGLELRPLASSVLGADGRASARSHVGSRPLLLRVQVCDVESPGDTVLLDFSEAVQGFTSLEVGGTDGGTCTARTATPVESALRMPCDADMRDGVEIVFTTQLESPAGVPLEATGAVVEGEMRTLRLRRGDLESRTGVCSAWILPAPEGLPALGD